MVSWLRQAANGSRCSRAPPTHAEVITPRTAVIDAACRGAALPRTAQLPARSRPHPPFGRHLPRPPSRGRPLGPFLALQNPSDARSTTRRSGRCCRSRVQNHRAVPAASAGSDTSLPCASDTPARARTPRTSSSSSTPDRRRGRPHLWSCVGQAARHDHARARAGPQDRDRPAGGNASVRRGTAVEW